MYINRRKRTIKGTDTTRQREIIIIREEKQEHVSRHTDANKEKQC